MYKTSCQLGWQSHKWEDITVLLIYCYHKHQSTICGVQGTRGRLQLPSNKGDLIKANLHLAIGILGQQTSCEASSQHKRHAAGAPEPDKILKLS